MDTKEEFYDGIEELLELINEALENDHDDDIKEQCHEVSIDLLYSKYCEKEIIGNMGRMEKSVFKMARPFVKQLDPVLMFEKITSSTLGKKLMKQL